MAEAEIDDTIDRAAQRATAEGKHSAVIKCINANAVERLVHRLRERGFKTYIIAPARRTSDQIGLGAVKFLI